ncbi:MAG: DUF1292 domain-containing protein [Bacillota bacterium]|nr:DUF1292 domain-containing protein [Bacillota bacterium]
MSEETKDIFDNEEENEEEESNIIILTDPEGNDVEFEHLDTIEYKDDVYVVLIETVDDEGVTILKLIEGNDEADDELVTVEDEDTAEAVYQMFKERNKEFFDFED